MSTSTLSFIRRGAKVTLANVPPERTLLEVLREDLGCTAVKEGCGEGDCGACTVVLAEARDGQAHFSAVNSCIRLAHSVQGLAVWTAQDLQDDPLVADDAAVAAAGSALHPVQQALVDCHGSQCGFCTPGFVMSLFGLYQNTVCQGQPVSRQRAQQDLSGNLCRCTGYRPILDAAERMGAYPLRPLDKPHLLQLLEQENATGYAETANPDADYLLPRTLDELLAQRAAHPQAQIVAGATDVGLWITKQHRRFPRVLDLSRVHELRRVETYAHHVAIGAAVTLTDAYAALVAERPQLAGFAQRFAALPVRNSGTLGGNVANGSPIGDSAPLLIALGASVLLLRQGGHTEWAVEDFSTGYRQNRLGPQDVLGWIKVPRPTPGERLWAWKVSKRFDDDISAVCLCLRLHLDGRGHVAAVRIGAGGVAATPVRAHRTEAALLGQPWTAATVAGAAAVLAQEFQPITDLRASADYRRAALAGMLQRAWDDGDPGAARQPAALDLHALEAL